MSRSRIVSSIAAASLGIALLGACSTESLTERAASFGLEQAIEGDQDIDLDFGGDGSGGFSISTDEGDFSLNFDEDNGGIVFNTDEGDGVISFDEDGIVFNTDEGDGVISFDQENGSIDFDTDAGDGSINFDDDGNFTVESDEGDFGIYSADDAPDGWPDALSNTEALFPGTQTFSVVDFGDGLSITGVFIHDPAQPHATTAVAKLIEGGWTPTNATTPDDGSVYALLSGPDGSIVQVIGDGNGYTTISVTEAAQ